MVSKEQIDEFYHILRCISNTCMDAPPVDITTGLTSRETIDVCYGLCRHLLAGGDYNALIKFSQYYGQRFLVGHAYDALKESGWKFSRIVEFGAGTGWLGRSLAGKCGCLPCLFIDKRPWALIDIVANLETEEGRNTVLAQLKKDDIIVMSDFLHCLDDPEEVMEPFSRWRTLVLEYYPTTSSYMESYFTQISRYGARSLTPDDLIGPFKGREVNIVEANPYIVLLIESKGEATDDTP